MGKLRLELHLEPNVGGPSPITSPGSPCHPCDAALGCAVPGAHHAMLLGPAGSTAAGLGVQLSHPSSAGALQGTWALPRRKVSCSTQAMDC